MKKTEPAPSPSTAGGGTSASDSTGSQHWQASKPEDVDPFTPVMMKLLNRLNGASSGRRDTLQALIDTPPDQRANGWFEKVAVQVSADPDDLVALVYPPEQEEA